MPDRRTPQPAAATSPASNSTPPVAYFSMEIGLESNIPTYSGGLGILAGDTLRSAADLGISMVGISLVYRHGYFKQTLDATGQQHEAPETWHPETQLAPIEPVVTITLEGRTVRIRAWRYDITGHSGSVVPVYLLDTALPENDPRDQTLTDRLYGGDEHNRLCQESVLGFGGVALLQTLGYGDSLAYHMNEGHSALLTLALLELQLGDRRTIDEEHAEAVRRHCIFTTHTPVPAGHDQFRLDLVKQVLGPDRSRLLSSLRVLAEDRLNMTYLALHLSRYINGVAMRHGEVSRVMFPEHQIRAITNGIHALTWTSEPFQRLFDARIPEWRQDNRYLRYAMGIPVHEIERAHAEAKTALIDAVERRAGVRLDATTLTVGFARRATAYKRADLIFSDPKRLKAIAQYVGPLQIIYAGKAHPKDAGGKALIGRIFEAAKTLGDTVRVVYLENYDMALAKLLCAGVDLWLSTPRRPEEASGTSGMKAAINGVPSFSVLDGWWIEGHVEGVTGWSIGDGREPVGDPTTEIAALYDKLERVIVPLFYGHPTSFIAMMRSTIALNGSFFNTQRMISQYLSNAYQPNSHQPATRR